MKLPLYRVLTLGRFHRLQTGATRTHWNRYLAVRGVAAFFVGAAAAFGASESGDARLVRVAEYLKQQREALEIPGLSAGVVLDNKLAWSGAYGMADVENEVPVTPRSVFRIGSISKMVTAVSVLQLVQSGRISLNENIREFVPELPDPGTTINIRHVLAQLSGIRTFKNREESRNRKRYEKVVDALTIFKDDRLMAKPGERFINSSLAYNLLGLLIERAAVVTYDKYLQEAVFKPADMVSSGLDDGERIIPHRVHGYVRMPDGELRNSDFVDLSISFPGEGCVSSAEDLARFAAGLLSGKLLSPELFQVMTTVHKTELGTDEKYGLGCFVRQEDGRRVVGHGGWQAQTSAFLLILPDQRAAVVILANLEKVDVAALSLAVAKILFDEPTPSSNVP